jgi:hypothetical protein
MLRAELQGQEVVPACVWNPQRVPRSRTGGNREGGSGRAFARFPDAAIVSYCEGEVEVHETSSRASLTTSAGS